MSELENKVSAVLGGVSVRVPDAVIRLQFVSLPQPHLSVLIKNRLPRRDRIIKTSGSFLPRW
jgi:hypothetical protein